MDAEQSSLISKNLGPTLGWSIARESDSVVREKKEGDPRLPMVVIVALPSDLTLQGAIENHDESVVDVFVRQRRTAKQTVYKLRNLPDYFFKEIEAGRAFLTTVSKEGLLKNMLPVKMRS